MKLKNQRAFFLLNKYLFPLFYLRHQGQETAIHQVNSDTSFKVRVNSSDALVLWEVWRFKTYRAPVINPKDTVVDIGAHIGAYTLFAAMHASQGKVIACEPNPESYKLLLENVQMNQAKNVKTLEVAISDRSGINKLNIPANNNPALTSLVQDVDDGKYSVNTLTLKDLIDSYELSAIDILKLDVEGAEYPILFSTPPDTLTKVKSMVIEYHDFVGSTYHHTQLERFLLENGFEISTSSSLSPYHILWGTGLIKARRTDT